MKVLKFGAAWCNGCLVMKPRWAEIEHENPWLENEFYDFDANKDVFDKYGVEDELPTFVFVDKNGVEFLRLHGEVSKKDLVDILGKNKDR